MRSFALIWKSCSAGGALIHFKKEKKSHALIKVIIVAELICVAAACYAIKLVSYHNYVVRTVRTVYSIIQEHESGRISLAATESLKEYNESISEELDEYLWTAEDISYRTGADDSYASAGTLDKDTLVRRTGVTHNEWSRVLIDDTEYFIESAELTDTTPLSALIAGGAKGEYQKYALSLFPDFGWSDSELEPLIYLWNRESGWNPHSHNKRSGAHGIPQALPARKMASEGSDYYSNAEPQIRWGLKYIYNRYGSPSSAWAHFCSSGWY